MSLVEPINNGDIEALRPFLNVRTENDFILIVAWLLMALKGKGPYPIPIVTGEQGAAKSTFTHLLKSIVDPNEAALRTLPKDERDLYVSAKNSHVLAFDNISRLSDAMSDALWPCRKTLALWH